jgi:hypothetical protein
MQIHPVLDYATPRLRRWSPREVIGLAILAAGVAVALRLWAEIGYRLMLFFGENHAILGMNHIDNGGFPPLYRLGASGAILASAGGFLVWRRKTSYVALGFVLLNLAASFSFYFMHRWLILVTYSEWLRMHGP